MRRSLLFALWIAVACCLQQSASAQILTENAGTVSPETPTLREMLSIRRNQGFDEGRIDHSFLFSWEAGREIKIVVPTLQRSVHFDGQTLNSTGLGDSVIRYKQVLFKEDGVLASERFAFTAELTLPTGNYQAKFNGPAGTAAEVPTELQNGMGSWYLGGGLVYTSILDRQRFSVEGVVRKPLNGGLPSETDLNLAYWYRITPVEFSPGELELRGVMEVMTAYRFGGTQEQERMRGTLVWLAPGLQIYPNPDVQFEVGLQVPISQSINDFVGRRNIGGLATMKIQF
jgi:hypothetical protein